MNEKQVHKFVQRYLEATQCQVLEKSPCHFTVKLSPDADRELTNRPYYWSFVDRTNAAPETMTYLLVTDREKYDAGQAGMLPAQQRVSLPGSAGAGAAAAANAAGSAASAGTSQAAAADAALGRSLGFVHGSLNQTGLRIPREEMYFGSRKLDQLFGAAKSKGSYVFLFQEPERGAASPYSSTPYTAWLGINMRVEFACDRKREEIHSFGISLATGHCIEQFHDRASRLRLTPRLPANIHLAKNGLSFNKALSIMEQALERKLKSYDYQWADAATERLEEELERIRLYYEPLIEHAADDEQKQSVRDQYEQRKAEIRWQYEPRVTASAINCGIFHLEGIE
ncbi:YqhG family protein [Paenibacillus sp. KS-LC4]|uniref:YqhG family protein n=1 Tax=Paenibacillus sp. KS-LC4 TaxID=2979727 RepID=UPI0030D07527